MPTVEEDWNFAVQEFAQVMRDNDVQPRTVELLDADLHDRFAGRVLDSRLVAELRNYNRMLAAALVDHTQGEYLHLQRFVTPSLPLENIQINFTLHTNGTAEWHGGKVADKREPRQQLIDFSEV